MVKILNNEVKIYKKKDGRWCGVYYTEDTHKRCFVSGKTKKEVKTKIKALCAEAEPEIEENSSEPAVYQRSDGRYSAVYYDEDAGKRKYIYGKTKASVKARLQELGKVTVSKDFSSEEINDSHPKNPADNDPELLQTMVIDYLMNFKKNELKVNTFHTYYGMYRKHIEGSKIGLCKITELTTMELQNFYNQKARDGYSSKTLRHMSVIINEALDYAVRVQMLQFNPNKYTILPKKQKYEAQVLTKEEVAKILAEAREDELYPIVVTCIFTGMRKGEIMALKWSNIDFENKVLHVKGSLCRVEQGPDENGVRRTKYEVMEPKTKSSVRSIPMLEQTYDALKMQKERQDWEKKAYEDIYIDQGFVFASYDGKSMQQRGFMDKYHQFLKKYGVKDIRFHDLRHTFASLLIEEGTSPKIVQELLGHSTITTTMDIYTHISEKAKVQALEKIGLEF